MRVDATTVIARMRMVKSAQELDMIRQAGRVAIAMGEGGRAVIAEGVPEYEVSLACIAAGTRKAAEIIGGEDAHSLMSPMIHNLQVLQSGHFTSYTHLHPTVRRIQRRAIRSTCASVPSRTSSSSSWATTGSTSSGR